MKEEKNLPVEATTQSQLPVSASPAAMMQFALDKNLDLEKVEKMIELQSKWNKIEAEKAYTEAMSEFKKNPPTIGKDAHVEYRKKDGTLVSYNHATLGNVTNIVSSALAEHGFSADWETDQEDNSIKVTCTVTHKMGHSKSTSLKAFPDESGGKNKIQAVASTVSYLERYTLLARVGLATHEMDNDGAGEGLVYITEKQISTIRDLLAAGEIEEMKFLRWLNVASIEEIPEGEYNRAIVNLESRVKK